MLHAVSVLVEFSLSCRVLFAFEHRENAARGAREITLSGRKKVEVPS